MHNITHNSIHSVARLRVKHKPQCLLQFSYMVICFQTPDALYLWPTMWFHEEKKTSKETLKNQNRRFYTMDSAPELRNDTNYTKKRATQSIFAYIFCSSQPRGRGFFQKPLIRDLSFFLERKCRFYWKEWVFFF